MALVLFTLVAPIEIVYARKTLGTHEAGYGVLLATWGAGVVVGSMVFAVKRRSRRVLVLPSTLAIGVAYSGWPISRELWLACAFSVLGGAGNGVQWVAVMTALQEATPADLQARITGLLESVASAMTGVGFLIGGIITAVFSPPTAFAVSGIGVIAHRRRRLRGLAGAGAPATVDRRLRRARLRRGAGAHRRHACRRRSHRRGAGGVRHGRDFHDRARARARARGARRGAADGRPRRGRASSTPRASRRRSASTTRRATAGSS